MTIPAAQKSWQTWATPPEAIQTIDALLNEYTDAQVATILNERGLHPGKGGSFRGLIIGSIRRSYGLKSRYERLREAGMLTVKEMAKALGVTKATVQVWRKAGLLRGYVSNDKGVCLFEPPEPDAPTKNLGRELSERRRFPPSEVLLDRTKEVQYES